MLAGVSGDLLSQTFSAQILPEAFAGRLGEETRASGRRALRSWWRLAARRLGPSSSIRDLFDLGAAPLLEILGHQSVGCAIQANPPRAAALLNQGAAHRASLAVLPWGAPLAGWRALLAREAAASGARWGVAFNGTSVRVLDLGRAYARGHVEFDIEVALEHPPSFNLFWACLREPAFAGLLESIVAASAEHGVGVCVALRSGVVQGVELLMRALLGRRPSTVAGEPLRARLADGYEQAIAVVYRLLFLLFAESRALLPLWHPVYRDGYSAGALRAAAERPGARRGLWEALQAVSRMAHAGCGADSLRVTAFNGRLFSPARAPLAERSVVDDDLVGRAIVALTTQPSRSGRVRIAFRDLGVEQLGAVYESVLDFEPVAAPAPRGDTGAVSHRAPQFTLEGTGIRRKASGTFYTPLAITDHLVRTTLGPLVEGAAPEAVLALRVLDPAMGSGAFLVAACRYLADAYERAIVRDTGRMAADVTDDERAGYRRLVAQRCLYGVDVNPMAVQVARLSMWLTTLAADQPLTFLDHHFATGNSLLGASLDDIARQRPGPSRTPWTGEAFLPFEPGEVGHALQRVLPVRDRLALELDSAASVVREKESALRQLAGHDGPLASLRRLADAWCAWWFWDDGSVDRPLPGEYADVMRAALGLEASLPQRVVEPRLDAIGRAARRHRFFHWTLAFPEVFYDSSGQPRPDGGFDAVLGNPPWEMVRADAAGAGDRARVRQEGKRMVSFARESGVYRASGCGQVNLYQLFVERALRLARPGARVGLVVPWGLLSDSGTAALRRYLFERCDTGEVAGFDNAGGVFPIHRGIRFALLTVSPGRPTRGTRCRLGLRDVADLDRPPADGPDGPSEAPTVIPPDLLAAVSGPSLAMPWFRHAEDLRLLEALTSRFPALSDSSGWHVRFGRELNASDDAHLLEPRERGQRAGATGSSRRRRSTEALVVEGRHIEPFVVDLDAARRRLKRGVRPGHDVAAAMRTWRVAYRDVASATNRLTVIAALVPPGCVTVHTVFCLKSEKSLPDQHALCAVLNSLVFNFLARFWVTTHVTTEIVGRLPAPCRSHQAAAVDEAAALASRLAQSPGDRSASLRVQAVVGRMYGLSRDEFAHVVSGFPLLDASYRSGVLAAFGELV